MSADWHVGMQVVCVREDWRPFCGETCPVKGAVYTVREVVYDSSHSETTLVLEEIHNAPHVYRGYEGRRECGFRCSKFRPVRRTDISSFEALLSPVHDKSPVMA